MNDTIFCHSWNIVAHFHALWSSSRGNAICGKYCLVIGKYCLFPSSPMGKGGVL